MRRSRHDETGEPAELAALADGSLPPERRADLEAQVAASPELAALLAEQERAVTFAHAAAEVEAPSGLRARVEAQREGGGRSTRSLFAIGAAATVAAMAVAVGLAVFGSDSPQRFEVALAGTELAPGVNGNASLTKTPSGWRIELYAKGLPRLDSGRFYEAWLRSDDGNLVPIGTFNEGEDVMLWAGVSPQEFPTLTVTREQADGDQSSSGEKVLAGTIDTSG
jgi:hypothetical protein